MLSRHLKRRYGKRGCLSAAFAFAPAPCGVALGVAIPTEGRTEAHDAMPLTRDAQAPVEQLYTSLPAAGAPG